MTRASTCDEWILRLNEKSTEDARVALIILQWIHRVYGRVSLRPGFEPRVGGLNIVAVDAFEGVDGVALGVTHHDEFGDGDGETNRFPSRSGRHRWRRLWNATTMHLVVIISAPVVFIFAR